MQKINKAKKLKKDLNDLTNNIDKKISLIKKSIKQLNINITNEIKL